MLLSQNVKQQIFNYLEMKISVYLQPLMCFCTALHLLSENSTASSISSIVSQIVSPTASQIVSQIVSPTASSISSQIVSPTASSTKFEDNVSTASITATATATITATTTATRVIVPPSNATRGVSFYYNYFYVTIIFVLFLYYNIG
jgi:hypothetical protein